MIRTREFGISFMILLVIINIRCKTAIYSAYTIHQFNAYYVNDSLRLSIGFYGNRVVKSVPQTKYFQQRIKRKINSPLRIHSINLLCYTQPDAYAMNSQDFLYLLPNGFNADSLFAPMITKNYEGVAFYFDTSKRICYYPFHINTSKFLYVTKEINNNGKFDLTQLLISTYSVTLKIKHGKNYLNGIYQNPYRLAYQCLSYPSFPNYLLPIIELQKQMQFVQDSDTKKLYHDAFAQYYSLLDATDSALYHYYKAHPEIVKSELSESIILKVNAATYLIDTASNFDIVAFNENHATPIQRYFLASLLPTLKKNGFSNIGFEALATNVVDSLKKSSYSNGFYTLSASLSYLINQALASGFTVFDYEDTLAYKSYAERDKNQAINIVNRLNGKTGKTILFCGFAHISKPTGTAEEEGVSMVYNLQRILQKSVLTVDAESLSTGFYNSTAANLPVIVKMKDSTFLSKRLNRYHADISVFLPPTMLTTIKEDLGFKKVSVALPQSLNNNQQKIIGFWKSPVTNDATSAPFFQQIITNTSCIEVYLMHGDYFVVVKNSLGASLFEKVLHVE